MSVANVQSLAGLAEAAAKAPLAVLHFWASWSEPCKHMDKVLEQLAKDYPQVAFLRVEAEEVDEVTLKFNVTTVPLFVLLKGGSEVDRLEGADPPALVDKISRWLQPAHVNGTAAAAAAAPAATAPTAAAAGDAASVTGRIKFLLESNPVILFMKGSAEQPRCGFSGRVVDALKETKVPFVTFDILTDEAVRAGLKEYGNWPTYPQLYVRGELLGGCDIVTEMHQGGELEAYLREKLVEGFANGAAASGSVAGAAAAGPVPGQPQPQASTSAAVPAVPASGADLTSRIKGLVTQQPVMLFMKGSPQEPRCGFSRRVVEALTADGIEFGSFDILTDEAVRSGLKEYGNWPTYPQLYVRGELLGGCDIVTEMHKGGELKANVDEMLYRMDST